jgi:hypothetical protein
MVRNCAPENLEIPGLVLTHHPGMTAFGRHFFTSGQREASSGWNASLPGTVAKSL